MLTMEEWQMRMRMWHAECEIVDDLCTGSGSISSAQGCRKDGDGKRGARLCTFCHPGFTPLLLERE